MEEKRKFFRLKNNGEIEANLKAHPLEIIEISSTGAVVVKRDTHLSEKGIIKIKIHNFSIDMNYEILRTEHDTMVLVFTIEEEINTLFVALRNLRDEQKKHSL